MGQAGGLPVGHKGPYEYRGTILGPDEIAWIQERIDVVPSRLQREIALEACGRFGWLRPNGEPAESSVSVFLRALANRGVLRLPRRDAAPGTGRVVNWQSEQWRIASALGPVPGSVECQPSGPLLVRPIEPQEWWGFRLHLERYHYLGLVRPAGESICYAALVGSELVGLLMWSAAALHNGPRDAYIGWGRRARERNLPWVVNQSRFLMLPWIRIYCLASQVLGANLRRLSQDWQQRYGHPVLLAETFVDAARRRGTCYLASNWLKVGQTKGWSRKRVGFVKHGEPKHVFLRPLRRNALQQLRERDLPGALAACRSPVASSLPGDARQELGESL
jgi:hypothetical protein